MISILGKNELEENSQVTKVYDSTQRLCKNQLQQIVLEQILSNKEYITSWRRFTMLQGFRGLHPAAMPLRCSPSVRDLLPWHLSSWPLAFSGLCLYQLSSLPVRCCSAWLRNAHPTSLFFPSCIICTGMETRQPSLLESSEMR